MTAIDGPQQPWIGFRDGTRQRYDVPRDTLDPRYKACGDHHPACDCREAEHAEDIAEYRRELSAIRAAMTQVLKGHRIRTEATYRRQFVRWAGDEQVWEYVEDEAAVCSCTGCEIARKADQLW